MINKKAKEHITNALAQGIRLDGRKLDEFRPITIEYDIASTAEGSARVTVGNAVVIAGVKMEVTTPYADSPDEGSLMVNAELLPLSHPEFEAGPPSNESIEVSRVIDRGIRESKAFDAKKLCIKEAEKVWTVLVDVCPVNHDGNLIDIGGIASIAAIKSATFPALDDHGNPDYKNKTKEKVTLKHIPIPITVYKFGNSFLVDPTYHEQRYADARLTITVIEDDNVCSLQKGGEATLSIDDIAKMVEIAQKCAKDIRKKLK